MQKNLCQKTKKLMPEKEKEKIIPFGVNLMRRQVLWRAAQVIKTYAKHAHHIFSETNPE